MSVPVKIIVVYHSGYGHTMKIAEAVARGAAAINGASVELVTAEQAPGRWELLDGADAIIMGAPTYMGSLSAPFKAFMDSTSHLQYAEKRWEGKIAAGFTNGASRGDVAPPSSDLRTAEFLGRRVAEVAQELSAGRAMLGRPANRGVSGGADNQDPEGRGVVASGTNQGTA